MRGEKVQLDGGGPGTWSQSRRDHDEELLGTLHLQLSGKGSILLGTSGGGGGGDKPLWLTSGHMMRRRETAAADVMLSTAQFWEPGQLQ